MQRDSLDVLEDEEVAAVGEFAEVRCCSNVRVLDVRASDRFTFEAFDEFGQVFRFRMKKLDGNALLEQEVVAAVNGTHTSHRDEFADAVSIGNHLSDHGLGTLLGGVFPGRFLVGRRRLHVGNWGRSCLNGLARQDL